jgi:hypothetical protein
MIKLLSTIMVFFAMTLGHGDGTESGFSQQQIPDRVFARMQGKSFPVGCKVSRNDLRYLRIKHYDLQGRVHEGEMICNKRIANDLIDIFKELYRQKYPIERMRLIDDYDADDEKSMRANNTSCFCYRKVKGAKKLSSHSMGMAIDINPLYNPCYKKYNNGKEMVQPSTAKKYCNRNINFNYKIVKGDLLYRLFINHGFEWGGNWRSKKDYQHFEKK